MKSLHKLVFVLAAFIFIGCSDDTLEEAIFTNVSSERSTASAKSERNTEFHINTRGEFQLVRTYACKGLTQFELRGQGDMSIFGQLGIKATLCTDFRDVSIMTGNLNNKKGEELFFETMATGKDDRGVYHELEYHGYTGQFKNFYGTARVYITQTYTDHSTGNFRESGSGNGQWLADN